MTTTPKSKTPSPIEIDDKSLERMRTQVSDGPSSLTYAHSKSGALVKPEDKGRIKGQAVEAMYQQTAVQFKQLAGQMQVLADQYEQLKKRVELSERIYLAEISFTPKMGQVYHLYCKGPGHDFLSLLSNEDWGKRGHPFQEYLGAVKLLSDHTWELIDNP